MIPPFGDMKKLSDSQAKRLVGDVHEFKQDVVGRGAKISSYTSILIILLEICI